VRIFYHERDKTYDFTQITETELQIFAQAFAQGTPFSDIVELYMYSRRMREQLEETVDELVERYHGK
jgi:hypothetical protein